MTDEFSVPDRIGAMRGGEHRLPPMRPGHTGNRPLQLREPARHRPLGAIGAAAAGVTMILMAAAVSILVLNGLPWGVIAASGSAIAIVADARPPESLVRLLREGMTDPKDYHLIWRHRLQMVENGEDEFGHSMLLNRSGRAGPEC